MPLTRGGMDLVTPNLVDEPLLSNIWEWGRDPGQSVVCYIGSIESRFPVQVVGGSGDRRPGCGLVLVETGGESRVRVKGVYRLTGPRRDRSPDRTRSPD